MSLSSYQVIEDLCPSIFEEKTFSDYQERLNDAFIRNFLMVKRYSQDLQFCSLSKYKKQVIPKYFFAIEQYAKAVQERKRKALYEKRKSYNLHSQRQLVIKEVSPNRTKYTQVSQERPEIQKDEAAVPSIHQSQVCMNVLSKVKRGYRQSLNLKVSSIFQEERRPKSPQIREPEKLYVSPSILNGANQSKRYFFKASLNQISKLRRNRNSQQVIQNFGSHRNTAVTEKSLEKKMIKILKKKKQIKNHIYTLVTDSYEEIRDADKKRHTINFRHSLDSEYGDSKFQQNQTNLHSPSVNFGLKGRVCLPLNAINNLPKLEQQKNESQNERFLQRDMLHEFLPGFVDHSSKGASMRQSWSKKQSQSSKRFVLPKFT